MRGPVLRAQSTFFLSHSLPVRPTLRPWLQARLGTIGFTLAYSALSLAVLVWLIGAAARALHSIQAFAATARGSPSGPMASIAT